MDENLVVNGVHITHYNRWTLNLMQREASGENIPYISREAWREVLGYDKAVKAKDIVDKLRVAA